MTTLEKGNHGTINYGDTVVNNPYLGSKMAHCGSFNTSRASLHATYKCSIERNLLFKCLD